MNDRLSNEVVGCQLRKLEKQEEITKLWAPLRVCSNAQVWKPRTSAKAAMFYTSPEEYPVAAVM